MAVDTGLTGFTRAKKGMRRRLIISTEAREKKGKTHFGLTMPEPIAVFDMDRGLEGVIDKFATDKEVYVVDYRGLPAKNKDQWEMRWEKFKKDYLTALEAPLSKCRSILIDTGTELWEYARLAMLGKLTQVMPVKYTEVNGEFRRIVDWALDHDKNLIVTHKMKKEYTRKGDDDKGYWTGKYERAGFSEIEYLAQVVLRHGRVWDRDEGPGEFFVDVLECRQNPDIVGERYAGEMCTFPMLAAMVFPDTNLEDWE